MLPFSLIEDRGDKSQDTSRALIPGPLLRRVPRHMNQEQKKAYEALLAKLADEGRVIEAGWIAYRYAVLPPEASEIQIAETYKAFYAGAQHLFSSILGFLGEGAEPSLKDLIRMNLVADELNAWAIEMRQAIAKSN